MKRIIFEKINIKNFLSFGSEPTELEFKNGIWFVTGINHDKNSRNGVGKTALVIESISYALFGETNRKINVARIANWKSKDSCIVQLWFSINNDKFKIIRSSNPSKLFLYKNDIDISKTIPQTNIDIISTLGISKDIFSNTLVMTNRSTAFLEQGTPLKTKFIEGILNLEIFSKMLDRAKTLYTQRDKDVDRKKSQILELTKNISKDVQYRDAEEIKRHAAITKLQGDISKINECVKKDNTDVLTENKKRQDIIEHELEQLQEKKSACQIKLSEHITSIKILTKDLEDYDKLSCPKCNRPYDTHNPDDIINHKKEAQDKINQESEKLKKWKLVDAKIDAAIRTLKSERDNIINSNVRLLKEQSEYTSNQNKIEAIQSNLNELNSKDNPFSSKVEEAEKNLADYHVELVKMEHDLKIYEAVKFSASSTGIRAQVIKKIISLFNERINYYLKRMDAPVKITFDEFFEDTIIYNNGVDISYGSLSGGEAKRVDFSMLFAFRDIRRMQSNISMNVSVFDEIFDSAIDAVAISNIMNLLQELAEKECFIIITHRIENIDTDNCQTIELEKRDGITRML